MKRVEIDGVVYVKDRDFRVFLKKIENVFDQGLYEASGGSIIMSKIAVGVLVQLMVGALEDD